MTLITKFKTGKTVTLKDVDDVDHDRNYIYVYMCNGSIVRCHTRAVTYYIMRYDMFGDTLVYPNK